MPFFGIAMIVIGSLIVIIYGCSSIACDRSVLIFNKLEQCLLPLTKKFHLQMLIDFRSLGVIKLPRLSTIDSTTYLTGDLHQGGLRL